VGILSRLFGRQTAPSESRNEDTGSALSSPGWDLVEQIFAELYPGQSPRHAAPLIAPQYNLRPGRSPVEGTHVYDAGQVWHYVTLGLTDLHEKSQPGADASGLGCEISMRVAKRSGNEPPLWPVAFLNTLAGFISEGAAFSEGTSFRTGPIDGAPEATLIEGAVALRDPLIPPRIGPFGKVDVLLLVGLTGPQLNQIKDGGSGILIAQIAADPARWVT
jgi:hypothetical protein